MGGMKQINKNNPKANTQEKKTILYHCPSSINPLEENNLVNERELMRSVLCVSEGESTGIVME